MATHSSILTWRISWTEKPGRLQSTGLQRVGHDYQWLSLSLSRSQQVPLECAHSSGAGNMTYMKVILYLHTYIKSFKKYLLLFGLFSSVIQLCPTL